MNKNCIISFANSTRYYINGLARLNESLRNNFDGDFLGFIGEASLGSPLHSEIPYAFKIFAFKKAIEAGYQNCLWLDSSVFAIKNVQPIFDDIEANGFIFQKAGHKIGVWTNDFTLKYFGLTRDEAMELDCIGNAGFLGFNVNHIKAPMFMDMWEASMLAGCFNGKWDNKDKSESKDDRCLGHRHDLSCSSIIVNQLNLIWLMKDGEQWLQYAGLYDEVLNDTIILKAQGI